MHLVGPDAEQQRKQAEHHEALDVVRIGVVDQLPDGVAQAGHLRLAGPHEGRHLQIGIQRVQLRIGRHLAPVDAADELPPTQDLANEALHGIERRRTPGKRFERGRDGLARIEQVQVQDAGQPAVIEIGLTREHGVLIAAETGQPVLDEIGEGGLRLRPGHRVVEGL